MPDVAPHPSSAALAAFIAGRLPVDEQAAVERHVAECPKCCDVMAALPEDTLVARLRSDGSGATFESNAKLLGRVDPATVAIPEELVDHPRYRVVRCLGVGGMGAAYLAEHRRMDRPVVLKVVRRELLSDAMVAERFQREVKAAARLSHPNIVQAHDADQAGELHFLVMEFVEGRTLAEVVAKHGPLPVAHACHYVRQAVLGLKHAHEKGMVHRDVKPQNLMLTPGGQVKILDFGLAQFARELDEPAGGDSAATTTLQSSATMVTAAGTIFGTPDYIAPEQAVDSRNVDIRADLYSLGCTLFFLLQGKPPFADGAAREKLAAHRTRPIPPLADLREPIPSELVRIIERMTAKSPADRYATPDEVARALSPLIKSSPAKEAASAAATIVVPRSTPAKSVRPPNPVAKRSAIGAAVVAVAAVIVFAALGDREPAVPSNTNIPASSIVAAPTPSTVMPVVAKKPTVLVLLPPYFQATEYVDARRAFEADGGLLVRVASTGPCRSADGQFNDLRVTPDLVLPRDPIRVADYDALYVAGGQIQPFKDRGPVCDAIGRAIDEFLAAGKPVASIGTGQGILAFRGTLADRNVSASPIVAQFLPNYAATLSKDPVVADGLILTAGDSTSASLLAKKLAVTLRSRAKNAATGKP